jgi:hypothetical protein
MAGAEVQDEPSAKTDVGPYNDIPIGSCIALYLPAGPEDQKLSLIAPTIPKKLPLTDLCFLAFHCVFCLPDESLQTSGSNDHRGNFPLVLGTKLNKLCNNLTKQEIHSKIKYV